MHVTTYLTLKNDFVLLRKKKSCFPTHTRARGEPLRTTQNADSRRYIAEGNAPRGFYILDLDAAGKPNVLNSQDSLRFVLFQSLAQQY